MQRLQSRTRTVNIFSAAEKHKAHPVGLQQGDSTLDDARNITCIWFETEPLLSGEGAS
jgi:hypothetical protein